MGRWPARADALVPEPNRADGAINWHGISINGQLRYFIANHFPFFQRPVALHPCLSYLFFLTKWWTIGVSFQAFSRSRGAALLRLVNVDVDVLENCKAGVVMPVPCYSNQHRWISFSCQYNRILRLKHRQYQRFSLLNKTIFLLSCDKQEVSISEAQRCRVTKNGDEDEQKIGSRRAAFLSAFVFFWEVAWPFLPSGPTDINKQPELQSMGSDFFFCMIYIFCM